MDFATGPLGTLLPKLAELLHEKYKLHKGTKEGIKFLCNELDFMQAALEKVGEVPIEELDRPTRIWAQHVRDLSYDMEDIVDTHMVDVEGPQPPSKRGIKNFIKKMKRKFIKTLNQDVVAKDIENIKKRAKELAEQRERYKVDGIAPAKKTPVDPRLLKALYTDAFEIVGIEEAKKEVITMLMKGDGQKKRTIVSIAGFGGLGKTTLAKAVYDEIKEGFHCTAFVSVSRNPDANKLLKDMLYELHKGGGHGNNNPGANLDEIRHLIDLVRDFLQNKRYLIVIDDIWAKETWNDLIGHALIENNMASRVITTTRIIDVAEHIGGCYRLKQLSNESSEMLFYGRIFNSKDKCPKEFSEVSKMILKKYGGVPLAIVTTSSLLANKSKNIQVWNDVCDSIGSGFGSINPGIDDSMKSMRKILLLSYYDLPSHLKTCLLYLSIFPEDYVIRKDVLIWRWVAEGFIQGKKSGQSSLEIGESYFNELINRSLIQPAHVDKMDGTPMGCRVHDIVLDIIISLSVEACFVTTVLSDGMEISKQVRRLSLHNNTTWTTMEMPKLRSLTIFKHAGVATDLMPSLSRYLLLRVLDLGGCTLKDLASLVFLGSLSHLRYLGLSSSEYLSYSPPDDQLPAEIGKLGFLQTLDLSETGVKEVPFITSLGQLKCLRGGRDTTVLPDGLKKLTCLEVLERVAVTSECIAEELGHLTQLRVVEVSVRPPGKDNCRACTKALMGSLLKLEKIGSLRFLKNGRHSLLDLDGSMEKPLGNLSRLLVDQHHVTVISMPAWINPASLAGLSYLDITVDKERREDIQVLGTLPCLRHLRFVTLEAAAERCVIAQDAFPRAERCEFNHARGRGVVPSMFPQGAMPRLQYLKFNLGQKQLGWDGEFSLDELALGHLPSLRSVFVVILRKYFDRYGGYCVVSSNLWLGVLKKLEDEAAVHPNRPRIDYNKHV